MCCKCGSQVLCQKAVGAHHGSLRVGGGDPVSRGFQTGKMRERLLWKGEDLGVRNLRTQGKTGVQVLLSSIRKKCGIVPVRSDP